MKGDKGAAEILNKAFFIVIVGIFKEEIWRNWSKSFVAYWEAYPTQDKIPCDWGTNQQLKRQQQQQ